MTIFLLITKFTGHSRADTLVRPRIGLRQAGTTLRRVSGNKTLMSMVIIGGLGSFFIGSSVQAAMPSFAQQLGIGNAGAAYGLLLFATGVGGVVGGFVLEAAGGIRPSVAVAMVATFLMGPATGAFALTQSYVLALLFLVVAGVANMVSMSVGQTVVQLEAPPNERRVSSGFTRCPPAGCGPAAG